MDFDLNIHWNVWFWFIHNILSWIVCNKKTSVVLITIINDFWNKYVHTIQVSIILVRMCWYFNGSIKRVFIWSNWFSNTLLNVKCKAVVSPVQFCILSKSRPYIKWHCHLKTLYYITLKFLDLNAMSHLFIVVSHIHSWY